MIAFVKVILLLKLLRVQVDVHGVGYEVQISLHTYSFIQSLEKGLLHTYLHIREDAGTIRFELAEKEMFIQLIAVNGVGAAAAGSCCLPKARGIVEPLYKGIINS
jgi:Holliday junction DNA helicase RuvA